MGANDHHAETALDLYAKAAAEEGLVFLTYRELAARMGRPGQERLLGDVLDRLRLLCEQRNLPDVATMVVSQDSLRSGLVRPADNAKRKYCDWRGLRDAQAKVMTFDWKCWLAQGSALSGDTGR